MEKLGIDPIMLLTQVINFVIMVFILTKFLYQPILKMLDERKKKIADGLKMAEDMKLKEDELNIEREKVLDKAKLEGQKIVADHKELAKKVEADIIANANEEAKEIKDKAKQDSESERKNMMEVANKQVLSLALALVKKVMGEYLDKKTQLVVLEKKLQAIERQKPHAAK